MTGAVIEGNHGMLTLGDLWRGGSGGEGVEGVEGSQYVGSQ